MEQNSGLTKDDFEAGYCARSGVTLETLRHMGREACPCACGESYCEGWQMGSHNDPTHFPDKHAARCVAIGACIEDCCEPPIYERSAAETARRVEYFRRLVQEPS